MTTLHNTKSGEKRKRQLRSYFKEVKNYVKKGLPKGHWFRESYAEGVGKRKKIWLDYDDETETHIYDEYNDPVVIQAARFRDGLVSDIYSQFNQEFGQWASKYKEQSEIEFQYLFAKGEEESNDATDTQKCTDEHHVVVPMGTDNAGIPKGLCQCSLHQVSLMNFHMSSVHGEQSQSCMRDKVSN
jgi:hypothetical protein